MQILNLILDLVFPKRCVSCGKIGQYFCQNCKSKIRFVENQICPVCQKPTITGATHFRCWTKYSLDGLISAVYYTGPTRTAIHKLKYRWVFSIAEDLVNLITSKINFKNLFPKEKFALIPIPLHPKREAERGFNQAEKLAKILAQKLDWQINTAILKRIKNTKPQTELPAKNRRKNVIGAFKVTRPSGVFGTNFILVDDLATTGSTLKSAGLTLKRAGAVKVWGLTFARTAPFRLS